MKISRRNLIVVFLIVSVCVGAYAFLRSYKADETIPVGITQVSNLTTNLADYSNSEVPKNSKFELTFNIDWTAPNEIKYDALAAEWSETVSYFEGNSALYNGTIYKCLKATPIYWLSTSQYQLDQIIRNNNIAYKNIKKTPIAWQLGNTYSNSDEAILSDNVYVNIAATSSGSVATDANRPSPTTNNNWELKGSPGGLAVWQRNKTYFSGNKVVLNNIVYTNATTNVDGDVASDANLPKSDGSNPLWVRTTNIGILEPSYTPSEYWLVQTNINTDIKPDVAGEYWVNTTKPSVNPYWPYDASPAANATTNWDQYQSKDSYSKYARVVRSNVTYECIKTTPSSWTNGTRYYKDTIVKSDGNYYINITTNTGGDVAAPANQPGNTAFWTEQGVVGNELVPGSDGQWQDYWKANPTDPVPVGTGISVDGLFSDDNWATTLTQPAFIYQDFQYNDVISGSSHSDNLYPQGNRVWKVRFTPTTVGNWQYKIKVRDASGLITNTPSNNTIVVTDSNKHGFVKVSDTDSRYFETSDGKYLNLAGMTNFSGSLYDKTQLAAKYKAGGINLARPWWQGSAVQPVVFGLSGQGGIGEWGFTLIAAQIAYNSDQVMPGELFSFKMNQSHKASVTNISVKPNTNYHLSGWVKTTNVAGPAGSGAVIYPYPPKDGSNQTIYKTVPVSGDTDWQQLNLDFTSDATSSTIGIHIELQNTTAGEAYFSKLSVKENLGNGIFGGELISRPDLNVQNYVSQQQSYLADQELNIATANDLYLKVVMEEKQDLIYGAIQQDGTATAPSVSAENVYANPNHASRTYQAYYWRYFIARFGYSTNIHSVELFNEGDPFNGNHYNATQALSEYFNVNDPNKHLTTTSNWASFPTKEYWSTGLADYADWHKYIGNQISSGLDYLYGWSTMFGACCGIKAHYPYTLDSSTYHSPPYSFYIDNRGVAGDSFRPAGFDASAQGTKIAISPGHTYTVSYYVKGRDLTNVGSLAGGTYNGKLFGDSGWVHPTISYRWGSGWWSSDVGNGGPGSPGDLMGTYDWTPVSYTRTAPPTPEVPEAAHYITLFPSANWAVGEIWYDDITMFDVTDNKAVEVPNGTFDEARLDYDSALVVHSLGTQVGSGSSQVINKPVIRGEYGTSGNNFFGDPYKGQSYTGENQQIEDDTDGVNYKKFIWAHVDPAGVTNMMWWDANVMKNSLLHFAKAYQNFMTGISLSNGKYADAGAVPSNVTLRAWGQKELTNGKAEKAHLWIDNKAYNWKAVIDNKFDINDSGYVYKATTKYQLNSIATNGSGGIFKCIKEDSHGSEGNFTRGVALTDAVYWQPITLAEVLPLLDMKSYQPPLPPPASGTITIPNMKVSQAFKLEWWDTSQADPTKQIVTTTGTGDSAVTLPSLAVSDISGNLVIPVSSLVSDIALKISVSSVTPLDKPGVNTTPKAMTFQDSYKVTGTKSSSVTSVLVNGTEATLTGDTFEATITLNIGNNTITVIGQDDTGRQSEAVILETNRRRKGDVNGDGHINATDLAGLNFNWNKTNVNNPADFNEDDTVGAADLAGMNYNWMKY